MKLSNKKETRLIFVGYLIFLFIDLLLLFFGGKFLSVFSKIEYTIGAIVALLFILWKIFSLKITYIEQDTYMFSIYFTHLFFPEVKKTILEVPIDKVRNIEFENGFFYQYLKIYISTHKGVKVFLYNIGVMSGRTTYQLQNLILKIKTYIGNIQLVS